MAKKQPYDPLVEARANPSRVKVLALNPAAARNAGRGEFEPYRAFPPEILACTNLEELEIFRGIAYDGDATIPDAIGSLTKLKRLSLGGIGMTELPAGLGKLGKLESLELYYASSLRALPKAIGKLAKLQALQCGYCESLAELPAEIGGLAELRALNLGRTALTTVPKQLWRCGKLETLILPEDVATLPPGIAALTKLTSLTLSVQALASIAAELPKLRVTKLRIEGKAEALPAELGQIATLVELEAGFLGLTALPPLPRTLVSLYICGNQLTTVVPLVAALPKLKSLDYAENPVPRPERRQVDALMKQSPSKRKLDAPPPKPAARGPNPELVGKIASINASLIMVAGDASIIAKWQGVGDDPDESDWDRARVAVSAREAGEIECNGKPVLALCLEMGCGVAHVFRIGERYVLVEGIGEYEDDELFLEWLATPLPKPAKQVGDLALPTATLAVLPSTEAGSRAKKLAKHAVDDTGEGLAIGIGAKRITLTLDRPVRSSWGEARRLIIAPA